MTPEGLEGVSKLPRLFKKFTDVCHYARRLGVGTIFFLEITHTRSLCGSHFEIVTSRDAGLDWRHRADRRCLVRNERPDLISHGNILCGRLEKKVVLVAFWSRWKFI